MACGVPVVAYDIGGPGELVKNGSTGWFVPPDDVEKMVDATLRIGEIDRRQCRKWVENSASKEVFAKLDESWISTSLNKTGLFAEILLSSK